MVAGEVGEDAAGESQTGYAVLVGGMRADLHGCVGASGVDHAGKQGVDGQRVGGGLRGVDGLGVDIVHHGRQQAGAVAHQPGHLIDEGGSGGLAVGAGDAHQAQPGRRIAIPVGCQLP